MSEIVGKLFSRWRANVSPPDRAHMLRMASVDFGRTAIACEICCASLTTANIGSIDEDGNPYCEKHAGQARRRTRMAESDLHLEWTERERLQVMAHVRQQAARIEQLEKALREIVAMDEVAIVDFKKGDGWLHQRVARAALGERG